MWSIIESALTLFISLIISFALVFMALFLSCPDRFTEKILQAVLNVKKIISELKGANYE